MSIPTHRDSCKTWLYSTHCWDCSNLIYILQCTCGSAVLFDEQYPAWTKHNCGGPGGIGGSGLSGWAAIDELRASGMPITPKIINIVFGNKPQTNSNGPVNADIPVNSDIKIIKPEKGKTEYLILSLMDFHKITENTKVVNGLNNFARQIEGVPNANVKFTQMTFMHNIDGKRLSYTALVPSQMRPTHVKEHLKKHSLFHARLVSSRQWWFIEELHLL